MWLIPILGLVLGALIGSIMTIQIPIIFAKYLSVAVLAALDSVLGGIRSVFDETFSADILLSGFFANTILAALLAYLGDRIGVDLYMAAVFVFGIRIFNNLAITRRYIFARISGKYHYITHNRDKQDT